MKDSGETVTQVSYGNTSIPEQLLTGVAHYKWSRCIYDIPFWVLELAPS